MKRFTVSGMIIRRLTLIEREALLRKGGLFTDLVSHPHAYQTSQHIEEVRHDEGMVDMLRYDDGLVEDPYEGGLQITTVGSTSIRFRAIVKANNYTPRRWKSFGFQTAELYGDPMESYEEAIQFDCPHCSKEIVVAVDGWDAIVCIHCKEIIDKEKDLQHLNRGSDERLNPLRQFMCENEFTLQDAIDATIRSNGIIGVGLITLAETTNEYIREWGNK